MKELSLQEAEGQLAELMEDAAAGEEVVLLGPGGTRARLVLVSREEPSEGLARERQRGAGPSLKELLLAKSPRAELPVPAEFEREMRLAAAIYWYERGQISQEKAAQIAGLDRTDFLMALAREGVNAFVVDFDDLDRELERG